ncbi:MAG: UDP-N-acetylglucosamine 2-epimerase, partial [Bacteroidales bacterium]
AFKNLMNEGFRPENSPPYTIDNPKIYLTGDIMYDNSLFFAGLAERKKQGYLEELKLECNNFILVTIHRDINTDDLNRLETILTTLRSLAEQHCMTFLMPLHPRTINSLNSGLGQFFDELRSSGRIKIVPPVSYLEMTLLEKNCKMIITDSGGVQKESHFFRKACIVLRKEAEWIELVSNGTVRLVDADPEKIRNEFAGYIDQCNNLEYPGFYGNGKTAEFILKEILLMFEN